MNGFFITFEGIDASGKTTQAKRFLQRLEQDHIPACYVREPGGSKISEAIREILLSKENKNMHARTELLLYAAARAQIVEEIIVPELKKGSIVVCDRYSDSTIAYQGFGRNIDVSEIEKLLSFATNGLVPDKTFIFDIDLKTAAARMAALAAQPDRIEAESDMFHERVRQGFLSLASQYKQRIVLLDGNASIEQLHQKVWQTYRSMIERQPLTQEDVK